MANGITYWNHNHPLTTLIQQQDVAWLDSKRREPSSLEALESSGRALLYLDYLIRSRVGTGHDKFDVIKDHDPGYPQRLCSLFSGNHTSSVLGFWIEDPFETGLLLFGPNGFEMIPFHDPRVSQLLPDPGEDWRLTFKSIGAEQKR